MDIFLWSSIEKAKLAVSILTPLLVLILGIVINNSVKTAERSTGLRSEIYRVIGGDLNDIYSYLVPQRPFCWWPTAVDMLPCWHLWLWHGKKQAVLLLSWP